MNITKQSVSELKKILTGTWENHDYRLSFNGETIKDGTVIILNKKAKRHFGLNFRIVLNNTVAKLQFINKDEKNLYFEDFPLFTLIENRLTMQNREVVIILNKVV